MNRAQRRKNGITQMTEATSDFELNIATKGKQIVVEFPKPIRWFGMDKKDTLEFIAKLQKHVLLIKE